MTSSGLPRADSAGLTPAQERVAVLLVILFAVAYRLFGVTGDIMYDPSVYAQDAYNLLNGTFNLNTDSWYSHRLPVFVPVALAYAILGVTTLSTALWPLVLSVFQIVAVLWVGRRLFGPRTAVLAAFFVAMMPLDVIYSGILYPDAVLAAFLTFSVTFWILAFEGKLAPSRIFLLFSGLFCGLAVDVRAYALLIVLFFLGYAVWQKAFSRALLWWLLGAAVIGVPVVLIYKSVTGDPLLPIRAMSGFYGRPEKGEGTGLMYYPRFMWEVGSATGLFALFFTVTAVWAVVRRSRERLILLAWMAPVLLYLQFGSMSFETYVPVYKRIRFLTPFVAPAALLSASVVWEALRLLGDLGAKVLSGRDGPLRRVLLGCLLLVLLLNSLWVVRTHRTTHKAVAASFQEATRAVETDTTIPVLFDHWRTSIRFAYYLGFKEGSHLYQGADDTQRMLRGPATAGTRLGYLKWYENAADLPDAFVVLEDQILAEAERVSVSDPSRSASPARDIPSYAHNPPETWRLVGQFGTLRVLRTH